MAVKTNGSIGFASAAASVSEGAGKVTITLNRTGDLSGAASVDFATSDGTAVQTSDYQIGFGTVLFAPGQTSKTFDVFITDDGYMESPEAFNISLSNPQGGFQVGGITSTTVTITDNEAITGPNPIANSYGQFWQRAWIPLFVRFVVDSGIYWLTFYPDLLNGALGFMGRFGWNVQLHSPIPQFAPVALFFGLGIDSLVDFAVTKIPYVKDWLPQMPGPMKPIPPTPGS